MLVIQLQQVDGRVVREALPDADGIPTEMPVMEFTDPASQITIRIPVPADVAPKLAAALEGRGLIVPAVAPPNGAG